MRFTLSVPAFLALASTAFAQTPDFDPVNSPSNNQVITAGQPFTIQWEAPAKYAAGTISIELIGGATQGTQVPLSTIASKLTCTRKRNDLATNLDTSRHCQQRWLFRLERPRRPGR